MYSIGEISKMFELPVSTLRYYDKEGLFPHLEREASGVRKFNDQTIETIRVIECLKKSGLEIKDIKLFIDWCAQGSETYKQRYELFLKQKASVVLEIERLTKTLNMLDFKCWYYLEAMKKGSEEAVQRLIPDELPAEISKAYQISHED